MNRVLKSAETAPFFGSTSPRFLDPGDAAMLDAAVEEAYQRGFAEGRQMGRSEAEQAARVIDRALQDAAQRATDHHRTAVGEAVQLGLAIADRAIGEDRFLSLPSLADRISSAVAMLDDTMLVVAVAPDDVEPLAEHLQLPAGVELKADRTVRSGEANITGGWSSTDVTRAAALRVIEEALA